MLRFKKKSDEVEFRIVTDAPAKEREHSPTPVYKKRKFKATTTSNDKPAIQPAWIDEDDPNIDGNYKPPTILDINAPHVKNRTREADTSDEDEFTVGNTFKILRQDNDGSLPSSKTVNIKRVYDANRERMSMGPLTAVDFSSTHHISLTASSDTTLAFFKVDGTENSLLRDRVFEKFPLSSAKFTASGTQVLLTGNTNTFRLYDLETGKESRTNPFIGSDPEELLISSQITHGSSNLVAFGTDTQLVYLADLRSLEKISVLRTKAPVRSFAFMDDGAFLDTFDASGSVFVFDLRQRKPRAVHQWTDNACTGGVTIASSPDSRWIACGSDCGFANVYQCSGTMKSTQPEPDKSISNLQTVVDSMAFHPSSEMLCLASSQRSAAVRLYHIRERQVFYNFPVCVGRLGYPTCLAFSPSGGGYLCVGQRNGRAALYRILHYADY